MPPKFANLKPEQVIRALKKGGLFVHETSGSHVQMKHPTKPGRLTVAGKLSKTLKPKTLKSIWQQAGLEAPCVGVTR